MKGERAFLDSNVLIYAFNEGDWRNRRAEKLIAPGTTVSIQVLNEFVSVGKSKLRMTWDEIQRALAAITLVIPEPTPLTLGVHRAAVEMSATLGYHIYDSLIIASAIEAKCDVLYSEDLQDGQVIGPLTIRNPFR